jgi:guanylate kinase
LSQTSDPNLDDQETCLPDHVLNPPPLLIVISGPSGVGKDATVDRMKARGLPIHFVVTATDRPKRPNEVHGLDYFFVSTEEFKQMIDDDELLEWAVVYGDYKGIPKHQIREALASGKDIVLRIDVQGSATIKELVPNALFIFLAASSMEELMDRLVARKTETGIDLERRKETARREMQALPMFDYVVVNREDELDMTVDHIICIIRAEKARVDPRNISL